MWNQFLSAVLPAVLYPNYGIYRWSRAMSAAAPVSTSPTTPALHIATVAPSAIAPSSGAAPASVAATLRGEDRKKPFYLFTYRVSEEKLLHKSEEKKHKKMKMTLQRAENLVHV